MNPLALFMILSFAVYLFVGAYVWQRNKKAVLNRLFFALNLSFAVWAFAAAFAVSANSAFEAMVWNRIGALGYCTFASIALHFLLVFTKQKKLLGFWLTYVILYLPAAGFTILEMALDFYTERYVETNLGWAYVVHADYIMLWAYLVHMMLFISAGLILCALQLKKATSLRERNQARTILWSGLAAFLIGNAFSLYAQFSGNAVVDISPIGVLIWSIGILYGISRYELMTLTPAAAAEDILRTIIDSLILVDPQGRILSVNAETLRLLQYDVGELTGKPLGMLFPEDNRMEESHMERLLAMCPVKNMETFFITKTNIRIPVIFSASECRDKIGDRIGYVIVSRDITRLKDMEERLRYLAHHDSLTNLPNRLLFNDRLNQAIVRAKLGGTHVAIVFIDLDHFKEVNDVFGHDCGDLLLVEVAKRLTDSIKESDTVVRLGGDEFIVLLNDLARADGYEETVQKILARLSRQYLVAGHKINLTASVGVSIYPQNGTDRESLMKNADLAMYSVKNQGRNNYLQFTPSMSQEVVHRANMEERLRSVLRRGELALLYQPVVDLYTGDMISVEALVRWNHPELGQLEPAKFIPIAEEKGLSVAIGEWVLRTACEQAVKWREEGHLPIHVSVNLSMKQFRQKNLVEYVLKILEETGMDPKNLLLEINESTILYDMEKTVDVFQELDAHGILTILDDFGTGYSSLVYLRKLPFYGIKIDRFFVTDIANDPECAVIVSAIVTMAHNLKFKVFAEGVDNSRQFESLRTLDGQLSGSPICDGAQGYLFSHPVSGEAIGELLQKQKKGDRLIDVG